MKIIDLIEHISESDETGLIKIKPFIKIDYERIKKTVIYSMESVNSNRHGDITFDDDVWRNRIRSINFSTLSSALKYEVKSAFLLANFIGVFEGGKGIKFSSVCHQAYPLINFSQLLQNYGINSITDFNSLPNLVIRNYFIKFIKDKLILKNSLLSFKSRFFEDKLNYGLFTENSLTILYEVLDKFDISFERQNRPISYPIVPSDLLKNVIAECENKISNAKKIIEGWEVANENYVNGIKNVTDTGIEHKSASRLINKRRSLSLLAEPLRYGFKVLDNLKLHVLFYILAYTGMRKEEALSCIIGCSNKHDGKYYVEAILTKTDETQITMKWIANKDTHDAITVLERYVKAMHTRAIAILDNPNIKITDSFRHQLRHGLNENLLFGVIDNLTSIKFSDAYLGSRSYTQMKTPDGKEPKFSLHKFEYRLSAKDIEQLESLGCNYKSVRGQNVGKKYVEGEIFNITPHMLRHNFAWFIIANRLGELDDIKHQFKHLASSMTMVYASRGFESLDEMINLFEIFEDLMVNNLAKNISMEASEGILAGEAGKRLNDGAKNLIFNVIASDRSDTGRPIKQLHFKNLDTYKIFLAKNLKNIRGLPHGYCTAGPDCKLKNVGLPSGCVYCPSYLVTTQQRVHWQAMKNFAEEKLGFYDRLPQDKKSEYSLMAESWRDTINAASVILTDKSTLQVNGDIA
ncbi:hypothetical protein [Shewanella sp. SM32]|uniref:hypothetical protein n=1 Tax=Shewanella sp. SM32 TaxID=2912796 RepID=UPI0021DA0454|nr:hypothetical protein [Shewanella sp. SM32]MCU8072112.1 hypothetical protein [Shewanella sp. SM32]